MHSRKVFIINGKTIKHILKIVMCLLLVEVWQGPAQHFEARHWGRDLKIICVEKANIDRSGAVAQGTLCN